jgi:nucleotide-binding universal stress UspA family protein
MSAADAPAPPYRHIACCLDESPASELALAEARRLRALGQGRLSLVHVFRMPVSYGSLWAPDPTPIREAAERWLAERAAEVPEGEPVFLEGSPAVETCEWARRQRVDLIVAAAHHGAPHRAVLGSFTQHLLHHAPCPVLVLPVPATRSCP